MTSEAVPNAIGKSANDAIDEDMKIGDRSKAPETPMERLRRLTAHAYARGLTEREILPEAPLPKQTFDETMLQAPEGIVIRATLSRKIIRYGDKLVKSDPRLCQWEAATMRFIAANTNIPVPRVYEDSSDSITMEYIEGQRLDEVWNELPEQQKLELADQLKGILSELRNLKGQYIGSIDHGKATDVRRFEHVGGPFSSVAEFNDFLLSDMLKAAPTVIRDIARRSLRTDYEIVFTHGDFAPRNIIVRDARVVALIDWEFAGWYPEYWEFVKTFNAADYRRVTWYNYIGHIFPKSYEAEYINDRFLGTWLAH